MKRRVGIIGTGRVGTSVAVSTLQSGAVDELLLHDIDGGRAEGEAMDLAHGAPFYPHAAVQACGLDDLNDTDAIVVSAGRNGRPGETRLDLLKDNAGVARDIARRLTGYRGVVVVVTNPVDVLTRLMTEASGLPPARVIGTGTMLDTARLRHLVGRELGVDSRSVDAQVVGEHGDSEVVLWGSARVAGVALRAWPGWDAGRERSLSDAVRTAAARVITRKGATNHAIGLVTADLLRCLLRGEDRVLTVSRVYEGNELGPGGVALSLPAVVGAAGATRVVWPSLAESERGNLIRSADILRAAVTGLDLAE